jgi:hypothetical protein
MADENEELVFKGARPKYVDIFQKQVAPPSPAGAADPWFLVCTMPSDVHHWKMYGIDVDSGMAGPPVKIAYIDEPANDEWIPLFGYAEASLLRYEAPKAIYAKSFPQAGQETPTPTLVIIEVWTTKLPSRVKEKEKSKLGTLSRRQV